MNIRSNKGITLITLVITVILLAILAYVSINIGVSMTGTAKFENVKSYMLIIKSKCEIKANEQLLGNISEDELYGTKQNSGKYSGWYKLSQADLNTIGVKDAKEADRLLCKL